MTCRDCKQPLGEPHGWGCAVGAPFLDDLDLIDGDVPRVAESDC